MAKTASKGKGKVEKVMHEFKEGTLKSSSGQKVTNRKQAVAVALSEARQSGARIPKKTS
jgi:glucose dehydrogenase